MSSKFPPISTKDRPRVIVCGTRNWHDIPMVYANLDRVTVRMVHPIIVSGDARGVDTIARNWARDRYRTFVGFHADWEKHSSSAGPIRNREMADYAVAAPAGQGYCVAFWNGVSPGTADMIKQARARGLRVQVIRVGG
jgi:hypothetical protein